MDAICVQLGSGGELHPQGAKNFPQIYGSHIIYKSFLVQGSHLQLSVRISLIFAPPGALADFRGRFASGEREGRGKREEEGRGKGKRGLGEGKEGAKGREEGREGKGNEEGKGVEGESASLALGG